MLRYNGRYTQMRRDLVRMDDSRNSKPGIKLTYHLNALLNSLLILEKWELAYIHKYAHQQVGKI